MVKCVCGHNMGEHLWNWIEYVNKWGRTAYTRASDGGENCSVKGCNCVKFKRKLSDETLSQRVSKEGLK